MRGFAHLKSLPSTKDNTEIGPWVSRGTYNLHIARRNGKVKAMAVVPNLEIERNLLIGDDTRATVYAAEWINASYLHSIATCRA